MSDKGDYSGRRGDRETGISLRNPKRFRWRIDLINNKICKDNREDDDKRSNVVIPSLDFRSFFKVEYPGKQFPD